MGSEMVPGTLLDEGLCPGLCWLLRGRNQAKARRATNAARWALLGSIADHRLRRTLC